MSAGVALREFLDFMLPQGCISCGAWIPARPDSTLACASCRSRLRPPPWPRCPRCDHPAGTGRVRSDRCGECRDWPDQLDHARSAYVLRPPASDLVHALKYEGWSRLADEMGRDMASLDLPEVASDRAAVVVPVPTTAKRISARGYNQAELLARSYAGSVGRPLVNALARRGEGATQVALHPSQRRANVKGAFVPVHGLDGPVGQVHAILVDDVLTTGATASAAASTLHEMGYSGVTLVTFARALPYRRP